MKIGFISVAGRGEIDRLLSETAKALAAQGLRAAGIELSYANYEGYPVYDQGGGAFEHGVSVIDLLMRVGPAARAHLKSLRDRSSFLVPA